MPAAPCFAWAAVGGAIAAAGSNCVAFAHHVAHKEGKPLSAVKQHCYTALFIVSTMIGNVCAIVASSYGSVTISMPTQVSANIFVNMVLQIASGMSVYTKSKRIGTYLIPLAVSCLIEAGPTEPEGDVDIWEMVRQPMALTWLALVAMAMLISLVSAWRINLEQKSKLLVAYAFLNALSTALCGTWGKMLTESSGLVFGMALALFFAFGVISTVSGAKGASKCDLSIFAPVTKCLQLAANMATGLLVWDDAPRIQAIIVFVVVHAVLFLGVYLLSDADAFHYAAHHWGAMRLHTLKGQQHSSGSVARWVSSVSALQTRDAEVAVSMGAELEACLNAGVAAGSIQPASLAKLCQSLVTSMLAPTSSSLDVVELIGWWDKQCRGQKDNKHKHIDAEGGLGARKSKPDIALAQGQERKCAATADAQESQSDPNATVSTESEQQNKTSTSKKAPEATKWVVSQSVAGDPSVGPAGGDCLAPPAPNRERTTRLLGLSRLIMAVFQEGFGLEQEGEVQRLLEKIHRKDYSWLEAFAAKAGKGVPEALMAVFSEHSDYELTLLVGQVDTGMQAGVGYSEHADRVCVVFRGTANVQNILADLDVRMTPITASRDASQLFVHRGFLSTLTTPHEPLGKGPHMILAEEVCRLLDKHPSMELEIVGHSLGGALALLFTYYMELLRPNQKRLVVTFGAPRVGDWAFKSHMESLPLVGIYQFQNGLDPVSRVPSVGYHHCGKRIWLSQGVKADLSDQAPLKATLSPLVDVFQPSLWQGHMPLKDHFIPSYAHAIQQSEWYNTEDVVEQLESI